MSIIGFKSFQIIDRNGNDRFDGADRVISTSNGRAISPNSVQVKKVLDRIGAPSLEDTPSLFLASVYYGQLLEIESRGKTGQLNDIFHFTDNAQRLGANLGLPWDESWAQDMRRQDLRFNYFRSISKARCFATSPDLIPCRSHSSDYSPISRLTAVQTWLGYAELSAEHPFLESESLFYSKHELEITRAAQHMHRQTLLGLLTRVSQRAALGQATEVDAIFQEARRSLSPADIPPPIQKILAEEEKWEILARLKQEKTTLALAKQAASRGNVIELDHQLLLAKLDPRIRESLLNEALKQGTRLLPYWASQGDIESLEGFLSKVETASKSDSKLAETFMPSQESKLSLRRQAIQVGIRRHFAEAEAFSLRGQVPAMDWALERAKRLADREEVIQQNLWNSETAKKIVWRGLTRELERFTSILEFSARQGIHRFLPEIRLQYVARLIKRLAAFPDFSTQFFSKNSPFAGNPEKLLQAYRWSLSAADWISRRPSIFFETNPWDLGLDYPPWIKHDVDSIDTLLKFAEACGSQPSLAKLVTWDAARAKEISARYLRVALPRLIKLAAQLAPVANVEEVTAALDLAKSYAQRPEMQSAELYDPVAVEAIFLESLRQGIDFAFRQAEGAANRQDRNEAVRQLKMAIAYSERAGIPFDEKRYGRILAILEGYR
jgi:hypothetical protein